MSDFIDRSVAFGLKFGEFATLDKSTREKLILLMARISEKSYRRGFQYGKEIDGPTVDPNKFCFEGPSLDRSPFTDTFHKDGRWAHKSGHSSLERLMIECGELRKIGFEFP